VLKIGNHRPNRKARATKAEMAERRAREDRLKAEKESEGGSKKRRGRRPMPAEEKAKIVEERKKKKQQGGSLTNLTQSQLSSATIKTAKRQLLLFG
jgi:hypothetical protein